MNLCLIKTNEWLEMTTSEGSNGSLPRIIWTLRA